MGLDHRDLGQAELLHPKCAGLQHASLPEVVAVVQWQKLPSVLSQKVKHTGKDVLVCPIQFSICSNIEIQTLAAIAP